MLRACDSDNQAINKSLSNFRRTYYGLNDLTLFIRSNKITLSDDFNQRIEEIIEVMKYYREIYAFVYKQTTDVELSMDLTQNIFISVLFFSLFIFSLLFSS